MFLYSLLIFLFTLSVIRTAIVRLEQGYVNGAVSKSRSGVEFHAFYGIPYAQPPIGELRFKPPQGPPPTWNDVKNGKERPPVCLQMTIVDWTTTGIFHINENEVSGSEDCLYLNVFTPNIGSFVKSIPDADLLPVIVFIHGGGFFMGTGNMVTPEYFMDKPVVLVGLNYRLGVFGFLGTGEADASGNYGMKDQVEALKWIRKNIKLFGGNPESVTIMGQSAGATSVHLQTFSPLAKDLFHKIIVQSGNALSGWAFNNKDETRKLVDEFLQFVGCRTGSTAEQFECLREFPAKKLKKLDFLFTQQRPMFISFKPTIEDESVEGAFLTKEPMESTYQISSKIPAIFGFTANESARFAQRIISENPEPTDDLLNVVLPYRLHYGALPQSVIKNITAQVKKIYFDDDISNLSEHTFSQLVSDFQFKLSIIDGVRSYPGTRFVYEYDYKSPGFPGIGAQHSDDIRNFFHFRFSNKLSEEDNRLSHSLVDYWTNFVRTGDPNLPKIKFKATPTEWSKTYGSTIDYLHISNDGMVMKTWNNTEKEALWAYISSFHIKPQFHIL